MEARALAQLLVRRRIPPTGIDFDIKDLQAADEENIVRKQAFLYFYSL